MQISIKEGTRPLPRTHRAPCFLEVEGPLALEGEVQGTRGQHHDGEIPAIHCHHSATPIGCMSTTMPSRASLERGGSFLNPYLCILHPLAGI